MWLTLHDDDDDDYTVQYVSNTTLITDHLTIGFILIFHYINLKKEREIAAFTLICASGYV